MNDLAQAHILAMEYLRNGNESNIFNLGNGVGFTVKEVVETARKVTGHPIPAKEETRRAGDPSTLIASSVLAYWYLVKYFWLLLPFYDTIKETAVISYGKTKKVQNQTYG